MSKNGDLYQELDSVSQMTTTDDICQGLNSMSQTSTAGALY